MRISRHQMFMEIAHVIAKRSTCARGSVGAIIVHDRNIIATGYNGPAPGEPHCTGKTCADPPVGCKRSIHAEINAVAKIPSFHRDNLIAYITDSPCPHCLKRMIDAGVRVVVFTNLYRINEHLKETPIGVYRMTPSGYIIDFKTGELE